MENTELVSALVDGQLRGDEFVRALDHLEHSGEARLNWHSYHVVSEVMRNRYAALGAHDAGFVLRLRARLQQEELPLGLQTAPDACIDSPVPCASPEQKRAKVVSANDSRWRLVVGLASVAMVGVMVWQGFQGAGFQDPQLATAPVANPSAATRLAQSNATVSAMTSIPAAPLSASSATGELAMGSPPVMLRDPQLDALLAAHRQFGGTSALQMPTGFLRNATFEEGSR